MAGVKNELGINERDLTGETRESKSKTESDFKELFNSLKEISNKFEAGVDKIRQAVEDIANYIKNGNLANKKNTKKLSDVIERTSDTGGAGSTPVERFGIAEEKETIEILKRIENLLKNCCPGGGGGGGRTAPPGGGGGPAPPGGGGTTPAPAPPAAGSWFNFFTGALTNMENLFLRLPDLFPKTISETINPLGMLPEINQFNVDMKRAVHQTQGLTAESGYILENFTRISKSVHKTGFNEVEFEKQLVKYARSGIKSSKDMQKIAVAQLNTERQLGLAAGSLHETFLDLSLAGNMTTEQIGFANKSMIDVARNTGITGDKLRDVVQSSQAFTRSLRNSGNLTTMSMKNVMQMSASFKKFGVEDAGSEMQKYLTDGTKLLLDGGDAMATIMRQAADSGGVYEELLTGTMTKSEKSMRRFSKGFSSVLREMGLTSMEQFERLSAEEKMILNLQAVSRTGKQAGELLMMDKALQESTKTFEERMADIKKAREDGKGKLTTKEIAALDEKESSLKTSKSLDILATISESFKGAKNFQEGASAFGAKRKTEGLDSDIAALRGIPLDQFKKLQKTDVDVMKDVMGGSILEINKGLQARGEKTLDITPDMLDAVMNKAQGGDISALREITEKITSANQILSTEKQEGLDPSTKILHQVNKEASEMRQILRELLGLMKIVTFGDKGDIMPRVIKDPMDVFNDQLRESLKDAQKAHDALRGRGEREDRDPNLRGGPGDPIEHFQVGTNRITENGLAYLHEGEIVVPKEFNQIAKGNGPFNMSEMTLEMPPNRPIYSNALAHANRGKANPESMFTNPIAHMKDRTAKPEELFTNTIAHMKDRTAKPEEMYADLIAHMKDATSSPDNSFKRTGLQTEELLSLKKDLLNRYSDNDQSGYSNLFNKYSDNEINSGRQNFDNRRSATVPYSPENHLVATNERAKAQMATMPSDKFGTSVVQEKNSAEMVSILREISDRLKNMSNSAPTGGAINEYGSRNYSKVDPRLSNMMGGSYTKSDAIKAIY